MATGAGKIASWSSYQEERAIVRDVKSGAPWSLEELDRLVPEQLLARPS